MARFTLSTYTLRVKRKRGIRYRRLDDVPGVGDFLEVVENYVGSLHGRASNDATNQRLLRVGFYEAADRSVKGKVETGEYGYETELLDVRRNEVSYRRQLEDAEMLPFYFLIHIPVDADEGLVVLQRFKQYGIRSVLLRDFRRYVDGRWPDLTIEMNPLVPEALVTEYLRRGRIKKIRFVRFRIPADIADALDGGGHEEREGRAELVISAKRRQGLPLVGLVNRFLGGEREVRNLIELESFPQYEDVKVEVEFGRSHKTIDLSALHKVRAYQDVTEAVRVGPDGHPSYESIDRVATELLQELLGMLRPVGPND